MPRWTQTIEERFWSKVDRSGGPDACWPWLGTKTYKGYGSFRLGRMVMSHRFAYEQMIGPIPEGLHIDHVRARGCTTTACCNPRHLEPVTNRENILRGKSAVKTHCVNGHPFTPENTRIIGQPYPHRICRACQRDRQAQYRRQAKETRVAA